MRAIQLFILALLAISLGACGQRPTTREDARKIADEYAKAKYSLDDQSVVNVAVDDDGRNWKVTYSGKGEVMGGPLIIEISKDSGRVVKSYGAQ